MAQKYIFVWIYVTFETKNNKVSMLDRRYNICCNFCLLLGDPDPLIVPRLDARYDWLPSPPRTFGQKNVSVRSAGDGCSIDHMTRGKIALVLSGGCSNPIKVKK